MLDVVIIGSGPAGLSASVYAKRAGLNAITLEKQPLSGGQILDTYDVDNYLGFHGIGGYELGMKFREHADELGCEFKTAEVRSIEKYDKGFKLITNKGEYETYAVIAAMGAVHSRLGVKGEEELSGQGVSYCATCDGAFFKGRTVAVVGGGDVAVEDAIYLARTCKEVYVIHRRDELRAAKSLQDKLLSLPNVKMKWSTTVSEILGEENEHVEALKIKYVKTGSEENLPVDGVFIAVGIKPVNELLQGLVSLDEKGYVMSGDQCITNTPGIFVAGDLRTKKVRQIVTAVADGANAVNSVESYLNKVKTA